MTTKSRATRAADKAAQDQQPEPEDQEQEQPEEEDQDEPEDQEPEDQPEPVIVVEAVPVTYYRPTVTMPDGTTVVCAHPYLHEGSKSAQACGRRIAAHGTFVK